VVTASVRKSVTDLTHRPARAAFTVATLVLAVASISFLAIPSLIDDAMQQEVVDGRLADARVFMRPVVLSDDDLAELTSIPNVAAVEPRSSVDVRVLVGERRAPARVIGVRDLADQGADVVRLEGGDLPATGELLTDVQNANVGVYGGGAGDAITVLGPSGDRELVVSGQGRSLPGGEQVQDESVAVFYADAATVADLGGDPGVGELALRFDDPDPARARTALDAVRTQLEGLSGFAGFSNLPEVRQPGDWPGRSDTETFGQLVGVLTLLALLSAIVLISNSMSTLVAEQTREVAVMRAVGARRRQVAGIYLRTTLLLGAAGAVVGTAVGIVLSSLLADFFSREFWVVPVGIGVDPAVVLASLAAGLLVPSLAALPAIRRSTEVDLREALEASGSALGAETAVDRALRHGTFLPRPMQIGLRNVGRRTRRSVATALIVAFAVGNLLATMALAAAATDSTRTAWASHLQDVQVWTTGLRPFDQEAEQAIRAVPGVAEAEPVLKNRISLDGGEAFVWAMEPDPLFDHRVTEGRWFSEEEDGDAARVAVVERNLAQTAGIAVGDDVEVDTAAGPARLRIIGVTANQQEDGTVLYVPLTTGRTLLGRPDGATSYLVRAESPDPATVDRVTTAVEDALAGLGYEVGSEVTYVAERDEVAANRSLTTTIALLGFVIVATSMVGLANTMTTNVLERTREIGILRCLGCRARDVRRIFRTEGVSLAVLGWAVGIPLGYLLTRALVRLVWEIVEVRLPVVFPLVNIPIALIGTVVLALLVLVFPVRRAVRLRPGDALRYD
jgi:putative ABC transport system permease protein